MAKYVDKFNVDMEIRKLLLKWNKSLDIVLCGQVLKEHLATESVAAVESQNM